MGVSAPSLHRESTDSLIVSLYPMKSTWKVRNPSEMDNVFTVVMLFISDDVFVEMYVSYRYD